MRLRVLGWLLLVAVLRVSAMDRIVVDVSQSEGTVSPMIYGQFLEHIYDSVVNGLWAQGIADPSFESPPRILGGGWKAHVGSWSLDDGEIVGNTPASDCHVFGGDRTWTDCVFSVDAYKEEGAEGFLILFRVRDDDDFYWWNLGGWRNAKSAVEREEAGQRRVLAETVSDMTIEAGRWYRIEVRVQGSTITCLLDGQTVCSFRDEALGRGGIGLGSWETRVRYRNARVEVNGQTVLSMEDAVAADSISGAWEKFPVDDATIRAEWTEEGSFNSEYCQKVTVKDTWGGIALNDVMVTQGEAYRLGVYLRGSGMVLARLLAEGGVVVEERMPVAGPRWMEQSMEFVSGVTSDHARLEFEVRGPGEVWFDQCTLDAVGMPYRKPIFDRVAAIQPAFIRWPGGCYAEYYRWEDGIGPRETRVTKPNYTWGGLDPNYFGTAEFIDLCRRIGAEPVIVLNIGHHDDPEKAPEYVEEALRWLEYCNGDASTEYGKLRAFHGHKEPFDVRYWEIGNETWPMGVEAYAERAKPFVDAMRAKQADLKFLLCGSAGHDGEWNREILQRAALHMDYLSVHHYMQGSYEEEMANGVGYPEFLAETGNLIAASANPEIRVACTEWNEQSISLRTGLYAGLVLNGFERYGDVVTMSCPALFIRRTNATAWNNAFINHDMRNVFVAPNYLVMKLYREHFLPTRVAVDAPEPLNVVATHDPKTREVVLKVVNPSLDTDVAVEIEVIGRDEVFEWQQWQVWSEDVDDANGIEAPERISVQQSLGSWQPTFPAHSVTVLHSLEGTIDINAMVTMNRR